mmetsp:Transcript_107664/g.278798  ORF Transcript_107664/g.278798 Transcript_107664/m.278798 type:complete len:418 (-) Transcript_107664:91-1344(-)
MAADHAALSAALLRAFDKGKGDFKVVVVPDQGQGQERTERMEFQVVSAVLSEWSEVFGAMLSHEMAEKSSRTLEIRGFSVEAVESFLRFMHSGKLEASPGIIIEVAALADKYGIPALQELCAREAEALLMPRNACEILAAASRVGALSARMRAMDIIHHNAKEALRGAYMLPSDLLEEVLMSPLLCIGDYALAEVFMEWSEKGVASRHNHDILALMEGHVQFAALTEEEYSRVQVFAKRANISGDCERLRRRAKRGTPTTNAFNTLWEEYTQQFPNNQAPFLGYWLNVIPSRPAFGLTSSLSQGDQLAQLSYYARGELSVSLQQHDEVIWLMPHHSVYITGIFLLGSLEAGSHVQVSVSTDGVHWEHPFGSGLHGPREQFVLTPCRAKVCAKWIKLTVHDGKYADGRLHVHGILQAA